MIPPRRAWIYARVSTRNKSQDKSPENQIQRLTRIAALKGWAVVGQGSDRASSAKPAELVELARGLEAIHKAEANVLMISDLDRLGGSLMQILDTAQAIEHMGGHLFIESHQIDTTQGGPIGRFFFQQLAAFSELRRTLQNDKIARGIASARARGQRLGRPLKHVFSRKLTIRALELRARGQSLRDIVFQLKAEKFPAVPPHPTLRRWILMIEKEAPGCHQKSVIT